MTSLILLTKIRIVCADYGPRIVILALPLIPNAIISIPPIRSVIASIMAKRTKPNSIGFAITTRDITKLNTPTPISNHLEDPEKSPDIP